MTTLIALRITNTRRLVCFILMIGLVVANSGLGRSAVGTIVGLSTQPVALAAAPDEALPASLGLTADSAIVISADTGEVLGALNGHHTQAMASTTKIMTALITIERAKNLDATVTVSRNAAHTDGSSMGLETGEKLSLRNLLYGMMLVSGNDAAVAIAEHIAGREQAFVDLMNARAAQLHLNDTNYENASGLNANGHRSSAQDLADLARVAMHNALFASIVRTGNWKFSNTADSPIQKVYDLDNHLNGFYASYPGVTGVKPGTTSVLVRVGSASFLGKTVISVVMFADNDDGDEGIAEGEVRTLFDYGFDVLFNLNRKESVALAGTISNVQIAPIGTNKVVTALRNSDGNLEVSGWRVGADGAITLIDTDIDLVTGRVSEIAIDPVGSGKAVTPVRDSNGRLKLITWSVNNNGAVSRLGDSGNAGERGSRITVRSLSASIAVTAMRDANGDLRLDTWELDAAGDWSALDHITEPYATEKIGITSYCTNCDPDNFGDKTFRAITGVKGDASNLKLISWNIRANGNMSRHLASTAAAECTSDVAITFQNAYDKNRIVTAVKNAAGNLELASWRFQGGVIERLADSGSQAGQTLSQIRISGLANPGWVMTALRTSSGNLKLISWRFGRSGELTRFIDSGSQAGYVSEIGFCQLSGNTFVTAVRSQDGSLKLISWKTE